LKAANSYTIDLTKIEGTGDFPCPHCGVNLSPEDESEAVYSILKTEVKGDSLEELILLCKKCGSQIHLVGFLSELNQAPEPDPPLPSSRRGPEPDPGGRLKKRAL